MVMDDDAMLHSRPVRDWVEVLVVRLLRDYAEELHNECCCDYAIEGSTETKAIASAVDRFKGIDPPEICIQADGDGKWELVTNKAWLAEWLADYFSKEWLQ